MRWWEDTLKKMNNILAFESLAEKSIQEMHAHRYTYMCTADR